MCVYFISFTVVFDTYFSFENNFNGQTENVNFEFGVDKVSVKTGPWLEIDFNVTVDMTLTFREFSLRLDLMEKQ